MAKALSPKQEAFCQAYVANGYNASQAAISAGYGSPVNNSARQMQSDAVKARLAELSRAIQQEADASEAASIGSSPNQRAHATPISADTTLPPSTGHG